MTRRFNATELIQYFAIALAFCLPLSHAGVSLFSGLLFVTWLWEGNFQAKWQSIKQEPTLWAVLVFFLYMTVSSFWSENLQHAEKNLRNYAYYLPIVFIFFTSLKRENVPRLLSAFISGMFISELVSYGIFFELIHKEGISSDNPSPFMYHIRYSIFLAVTALLIINQIFYEKTSRLKRIFLLIFFITVVSNLFINVGRTGEVAFLVGLFFLLLSHLQVTVRAVGIASVALAGIIFLGYTLSPVVQERVQDVHDDLYKMTTVHDFDTSLGGRYAMAVIGIDIIKDSPIFGAGIGDDYDLFMQRLKQDKFYEFQFLSRYPDFHDQYIQTLVRGGAVGLFLLLLMFIFLKISARRDSQANHIAVILLTVYLLGFFTDPLMTRQFPMVLFSFLAGVILAQSRMSEVVS